MILLLFKLIKLKSICGTVKQNNPIKIYFIVKTSIDISNASNIYTPNTNDIIKDIRAIVKVNVKR